MTDKKDSALTSATPVITDAVRGLDDPSGTPASVTFLLSAIRTLFNSFNQIINGTTSTTGTGDMLTTAIAGFTNASTLYTLIGNDNTVNRPYIQSGYSGGVLELLLNPYGGNVGIGMSPVYKLQLSTDSAGKPSTNTWTIVSDEQTKDMTKQKPYLNGMNWLKTLPPPIYFTYNGKAGTPQGEESIGWNAQDLLTAAPRMVSKTRGKLTPAPAKNKKGESIPLTREIIDALPETDILGVNTHEMQFAVFNAVLELDKRLSALEMR